MTHIFEDFDRVRRWVFRTRFGEVFSVKFGLRVCNLGGLWFYLFRLGVSLLRDVINPATRRVIALKGVTVWQAVRCLHDGDTPAAFPRQPICLVFTVHHVVGELALHKVKVDRVVRKQFGQKLVHQHSFALE